MDAIYKKREKETFKGKEILRNQKLNTMIAGRSDILKEIVDNSNHNNIYKK